MSNLFDLNDRIFAAMDELDAADTEDEKKLAIEKARTKVSLFNAAISNANMIAKVSSMQESTMDGMAMQVGASRMLLGQPTLVADVEQSLPPADFDAVAWVQANARGHSISWIRDSLSRESGVRYSFEEADAVCEEAGIEPISMTRGEKWTLAEAESDSYGLHGPQRGYVR